MDKPDRNQTDIETIPCPYCNQDIVPERPEHNCRKLIGYTSYIHVLGHRVGWTADMGWWSFKPDGTPIEPLTFAWVVNNVARGRQWFPVTEMSKLVKAAAEATDYFTDDELEAYAKEWLETDEGKAFVSQVLGAWRDL